MDIAIKNTLNEIAMQIQVARRSVKEVARDCAFYAKQTNDIEAKTLFGNLSECKTRKQMLVVLGNF